MCFFLSRLRKPFVDLIKHHNVLNLWGAMTQQHCKPRVPDCKNAGSYRTVDGACNNLNYPTWGMSQRAQQRYIPPEYHDGKTELVLVVKHMLCNIS